MLVVSEILEKNKASPFELAQFFCGFSILFDDLKILFLHSLSNSYMKKYDLNKSIYRIERFAFR